MLDVKGRLRAVGVLGALLLLVVGTVACKLGGGSGLDEANRLNRSAGEDISEIEKLVRENKDKEGEVTRALNAEDFGRAKRLMDETINAIDRGLERGRSAADKLEKASKLDIDPTIKEYLSLRAQSVDKAIEAFKALRQGIETFRDAAGSKDKAVTEKARDEVQRASQSFDSLISESERLGVRADDIARRNPDKIKPGS